MAKRTDSKRRKLNNGEFVRSDGMYAFRTVIDGKRRTIYSKSLSELRIKEEKLLENLEKGLDIDKQKLTLNDVADKYLESKAKSVQITTLRTMTYYYDRYVRDELGKKKIADIKRSQIKDHYLHLISRENRISISTLIRLDTVLKPMFESAVYDDIILKNPAKGIITEIKNESRETPKKVSALTEEQQDDFMSFLMSSSKHEGVKNLIVFLLGTGCRIGEALALQWSDVNFDRNFISINQAVAYTKVDGHYKHLMKRTKSESGDRIIPMLKEVREALEAEKLRQKNNGMIQPDLDGYNDFVFLTIRNTVYTRENVLTQIKQVVKEYNKLHPDNELPDMSTHQLRHTFTTRLCRNSDDLKAIQKILGHKDISTTLNIYADATEDGIKESMQALEGKMFKDKNKE